MPLAIKDLKAQAAQVQSAINRLAVLRPSEDPETGLSMRQDTPEAAKYRAALDETLAQVGGAEEFRLAMDEGEGRSLPASGGNGGSLTAADLAASPLELTSDLSIDNLKAMAAGIGAPDSAGQVPSLEDLRAHAQSVIDQEPYEPEQPQAPYTAEPLQRQAARFRETLKGGVPYLAKPVGGMIPEEAGYRGFGANLVGGAAGLGADVLKTLRVAPETAASLERTRRGTEVLGRAYAEAGGAKDLIDAYNEGWSPFFKAVRFQLGQVPGMAGLALAGGGLAGVPGAAATFAPLSYTEVRGATERAGLDPETIYTIPGTDIRLKGRSFNLIMTVPHAAVEVFGFQRFFGRGKNINLIRAFIEELGEEAVQYLIAEMNVEAQKNPELAPFVEAMADPDKLTAAAREMVNAIPQVAVLTGLGAASQRFAAKAEPVGAVPRTEPTLEPRQPVFQEREFTGQTIREPDITPAPPGVPGERGKPFTRPGAPPAPGLPTGEASAAPGEPVVVRPGEDIPGRPIPPAAPAVPQPPVTIIAAPPPEGPAFPRDEPGVPAPRRVRIPPEAGSAIPETTEVAEPGGAIRVEPVRRAPEEGAKLGPIKFRSVRRAIDSYLDEHDRLRNARGVTPERKAEARRLQEDAINRLEDVKQQIQRAQIEGREIAGPIEFRLRSASGAMTIFQLQPDFEGIAGLQKRLAGRKAESKFYSRTPSSTAGLMVPEVESVASLIPGGVERTIGTEQGTARIVFPDDIHVRLFDLAEGKPDKAEARTLYNELEGYILERFKGPPAVIALAREYRREVLDQAGLVAGARGGGPERAPLVVDVDEQTRYLQRPTLESLRAHANQLLGRQPEGKLPAMAFAAAPETAPSGAVPDTGVPSIDDLRQHARAAVQAAVPGAVYQGFARDQVEGTTPPTPLRREDILRPLLKSLGVPLYQGRIKSKKFLGFYRRHIEEVRKKRMNDIEVAAHEIGHLLDDRFPEIRAQWLPASNANKVVREELRGVSYDKSKIFEGFAEFVRLWATQREEAQARAPKFYGWFEDFLSRNEHGPALRKAQEGMHAWINQDARSRARSKMGVTKAINAGLTTVLNQIRQAVPDDLHGIYEMERQLTGEIAPVGPYETARLTRGRHAMLEGILLYGTLVVKPDGSHAFEGKGLSQILDPVAGRLDDFWLYAVGVSARELMSQGREHLFTPAEIKGMVALETPAFRKAFAEYQEWNNANLDFAEDKGVINPFFRATWKRSQYLPFHRVGQPGAFSAVPGDWRGIRALTGGTDNLRDILGNVIGNASMLIDAALTNEARVQVADLVRQQRGGARFMAKIPKEERIVKVHKAEVEHAILEALGVAKKTQLDVERQKLVDQIVNGMGAMVPLIQRGQTPYGPNVVAVLREGKPEYYEVADPLLYRSLLRLNRPMQNWFIRVLGFPKRIGQLSITLAFDFLAANFQRDTMMGWVMSQHGFKPIKDSAIGLASRLRSDPNYRNFVANGGGFSSYLRDETAFRKHLERFYSSKGINYRAVLDSPAKLFFALERIADSIEMATRLGEYRRAIQAGEHPRHAAYSGREVSTDFAMRGGGLPIQDFRNWVPLDYAAASLGVAYDIIIFLKPGINGIDRLYRGLFHDPNKAQIARRTAMIAFASMALTALWRGIPEFDDLEDWDRDAHWHFFIPRPETIQAWADERPLPPSGERYWHFRLMKIWEVGGVGSLAERALERSIDGEPGKFGEDAWRILRNVFRFEYLPQAIAPIYETATNRNRFLDRPIETPAIQELQPWARSRPGGSRTLRALGEAERKLPTDLQASPAQVEALLRGYLNTWAQYGLMLSDAAFFDDTPSLRVDQYPVLRRFYQGTPPRHTKYVTQLYDALAEATAARKTMRHMARTFRPEFAKEIADTPENLEYGQLTGAQKGMRAISAEMRFVVNTPDLPTLQQRAIRFKRSRDWKHVKVGIPRLRRSDAWNDLGDLKRELLDLWTEERNTLAKKVMQNIEAQRKRRAGPLGVIVIRPGQVSGDRQ